MVHFNVVPKMDYPRAIYETGESVKVGDHVTLRTWIELWLKKNSGRVFFVPGISDHNPSMEYNGLKWVSVRYAGETETGILVHPETGIVKGVKFVRRTDDSLMTTPEGYEFSEE